MKIEIEFTCPSNKELQYAVGCVSWSSSDPKQTRVASRLKMVAFKHYGRLKNVPKNEEEKKRTVAF